jgi:O-antigen/teichoic acid export membrane protein
MSGTAAKARLTEGPVGPHLVRLTIPMIWGLLAFMTFGLVDTFFVGRLGAPELAAMSFAFPVMMVLISIAIGLGAGTSSVLARAIGEGDQERVKRLTTDSLVLAFLVVAVVSLAGIATIEPLFALLGAGPELRPLVRDYMVIWYLGVVFLVVPMVGMSAIRATGDSRLPGLVMTGSALLNILLDPLLIFGLLGLPRLELEGAALATVISRGFTFVIALWVLHARLGMLSFAWPGLPALARSWRAILHVGLPAAGTNVVIPLTTGAVVALIARFGPDAVAGYPRRAAAQLALLLRLRGAGRRGPLDRRRAARRAVQRRAPGGRRGQPLSLDRAAQLRRRRGRHERQRRLQRPGSARPRGRRVAAAHARRLPAGRLSRRLAGRPRGHLRRRGPGQHQRRPRRLSLAPPGLPGSGRAAPRAAPARERRGVRGHHRPGCRIILFISLK